MFAGVAEARMYQWNNPQTGPVQLSGTPPTWYRGSVGGPRVLVYESGVLVDDTSLKVSEERAFDLREAAFDEAERRKERVVLKRLKKWLGGKLRKPSVRCGVRINGKLVWCLAKLPQTYRTSPSRRSAH